MKCNYPDCSLSRPFLSYETAGYHVPCLNAKHKKDSHDRKTMDWASPKTGPRKGTLCRGKAHPERMAEIRALQAEGISVKAEIARRLGISPAAVTQAMRAHGD